MGVLWTPRKSESSRHCKMRLTPLLSSVDAMDILSIDLDWPTLIVVQSLASIDTNAIHRNSSNFLLRNLLLAASLPLPLAKNHPQWWHSRGVSSHHPLPLLSSDTTQIALRSELLSQVRGSVAVIRDRIHKELENLLNLVRLLILGVCCFLGLKVNRNPNWARLLLY